MLNSSGHAAATATHRHQALRDHRDARSTGREVGFGVIEVMEIRVQLTR